MRLLLDTCTLVWAASEPEKLSPRIAERLTDSSNELFVSVASLWELVLKYNSGRLELAAPPDEWFSTSVEGRAVLNIEVGDVEAVHRLGRPTRHADPLDRLLIATAQARGLAVLTPDPAFRDYPIPILW